jgi:hypothetical protein
MSANQAPQITLALLGILKRFLTVGFGLPQHMTEDALLILTDVHTGADKAGVSAGESLEALIERRHQARLMTRINHKLDELTERKV